MAQDDDHLINLMMKQDNVVQSWISLLMTIEAGMILILGFVLRPEVPGQTLDPGLRQAASFVVPFFGSVFAIVIGRVVIRERKWASWFMRRFSNPVLSPTIFPSDPTLVSGEKMGYAARAIWFLVASIVAGWIVVFYVLRPWA